VVFYISDCVESKEKWRTILIPLMVRENIWIDK